jgi:hypothetical protein
VPDWVLAAERAYVAVAMQQAPHTPIGLSAAQRLAAAGAVASRYLAVGTPRSLAIIGDGALSIEAHTTWFSPTDLRSTTGLPGTRQVPLAEALTADIVCIHEPLAIAAGQLRRGTHVNALAAVTVDAELVLQRYDEAKDLPALAAGLIDGRVLDEITIFTVASGA